MNLTNDFTRKPINQKQGISALGLSLLKSPSSELTKSLLPTKVNEKKDSAIDALQVPKVQSYDANSSANSMPIPSSPISRKMHNLASTMIIESSPLNDVSLPGLSPSPRSTQVPRPGLRLQRQGSLLDQTQLHNSPSWNQFSFVGIKKKNSFLNSPVASSESLHSNTFQSPAMGFLQGLNSQSAVFSLSSNDGCDDFCVGDEIGEYTLTKQIGKGAFSLVFEAVTDVEPPFKTTTDINHMYRVALKIVPKHRYDQDNRAAEAQRLKEALHMKEIDHENAIWSRLFHPFILQMSDMIQLDEATIIVSELASNGTLLDYVFSHGRPGLPDPSKRELFSQMAHALRYLHKDVGIAHHDFKLENVLLNHDLQVKICDFGLSDTIGEGEHPSDCQGVCCSIVKETQHLSIPRQKTSSTAGSLHYLAPEQLQGKHKCDGSSDIWALGCCLYAMDTGSLPFNDSFLPRLQMFIMLCKYEEEGLSTQCGPLIRQILVAEVEKRITIDGIINHEYCLSMDELAELGFK